MAENKGQNVPHKHEPSNVVKMAEKIKKGQPPSNVEIKQELNATEEFLREKEGLSKKPKEEQVLRDARRLVEASKISLDTKNPNEQAQQLIKDVQIVMDKPPEPYTEAMWKEIKEFLAALNELVTELLKSMHFRQSLVVLIKLMKEIFIRQEQQFGTSKKVEQTFVYGQTTEAVKQAVNDMKETVKHIDDLPKEQRLKIRKQFKELINEVSSRPETTLAIKNFLKILFDLKSELYDQLRKKTLDRDVQKVQVEAKQFIEKFTGGKKLDNFLTLLRTSIEKVEKDKEFRQYLKECREYIEKALDNPALVEKDEFWEVGNNLIDRGREFSRIYEKDPTLNLCVDEASALLEEMKNDETLKELKNRAQKFFENFTYTDNRGKERIDMDIITETRTALFQLLKERIKEIPVQRIEIKDKNFEYLIIDDIYVKIGDILPDQIKIHAENNTELNINQLTSVKSTSCIKFLIEGMKPQIRDCYFCFKRKKFLKLEDEGRANLRISGAGLDICALFYLKKDSDNRAILGDFEIDVKVHKMNLNIIDAKHKGLLNFITSLFSGRIEKQIENAIKKKLYEIGKEWAEVINKRVMSRIPSAKTIGEKIEEKFTTLV